MVHGYRLKLDVTPLSQVDATNEDKHRPCPLHCTSLGDGVSSREQMLKIIYSKQALHVW